MEPNAQALTLQQGQEMRQLLSGQAQLGDTTFADYQSRVDNQEKLPALYTRLNTELGVGDLSKTVQGYKDQIGTVQQLLGNLTGDINNRNKGQIITNSQMNRQIAAEGDPLRTNLANLGYAMQPSTDLLTSAQGSVNTLLGLYQQQDDRELDPVKQKINFLSDRFAREITGYTTAQETELTGLMDKLQRDRQLSDREWQKATDAAVAEKAYQRQLSLTKASMSTGLSMPAATAKPAAGGKSAIDWLSLGSGGGGGLTVRGSSGLGVQGGNGGNLQGGGGIRLQ